MSYVFGIILASFGQSELVTDPVPEIIAITSIKSGRVNTSVAIQVNYDVNAMPNTDYKVKIEATRPNQPTIILDSSRVTTLADGKRSGVYKNLNTTLTAGTIYTITVKLYKASDNTTTATPLSTAAQSVTISTGPFQNP